MDESALDANGWSEALRATHQELSEEDLKFRSFAYREACFLQRSTFAALDADVRLHYRQQPWLTFVGKPKLEYLKNLSLALAALIRSLPQRLFRNDPAKIADFYGLRSAAAAEIILSQPNCIEESMARGDLIDTADGFKCIEFNFTPNLGGWETSLLAELHLGVPQTAQFIAREGVRYTYTSTLRIFFLHVIQLAGLRQICGQGELNVACAFDPSGLDHPGLQPAMDLFQREFNQSLQDVGTTLRGSVVACHYGQLVPARGKVYLGKTEIHALVELCLDFAPLAIYRCFKSGRLLLFNGPVTDILTDKRNIGLLSENDGSDLFSPEERETIRKHVPWTRRVRAENVRFQSSESYLPDLLAAVRQRLVLKQARNMGGKGVFLGQFTSAAQWDEMARTALEQGGWVVQERLESLPYLYQCGEQGCALHDVIWGPFVFGSEYAGVILRMQPKTVGGAVNLSLEATEGVVFEV